MPAIRPKLRIRKGFQKVGTSYKKVDAPPASKPEPKSDEPENRGIFAQLMRHKDQGERGAGIITFDNDEKVKVSPEHRDTAIRKIQGMMGAGKNPDERDRMIKSMAKDHKTFMAHVTGTYKPEPKHPMSAAREETETPPFDPPYKTKKRGSGGPSSEAKWLAKAARKEIENHVKKQAKEETTMTQEEIIERLKKAVEDGVLSEEDLNLILANEEVKQVDEKELSPKQKKIAAMSEPKDKIDAGDLAKLREGKMKEEVTVATAQNRFLGVESTIRDILSQNLNLREKAKQEKFKKG